MRFSKIVVVMLVFALIVSFSGCKKSEHDVSSSKVPIVETQSDKNYLTLLYSASDTFNPYTATMAVNRQLCRLLFESLIKLDNEYNVYNSIANSVNTDGNTCTVTLKDVFFSDGTAVTASDVVYSYNLARTSTTKYATKLYEVSSISASGSKTVVFKLSKVDPYFVNVLDFPIIKSGSDKIADSDGVVQPPVGCGRYKLSDDHSMLIQNDKYYEPSGSIKEIHLINAPDEESLAHYVEIGASDMYFSNISDGKILRMSGKKVNINLNNLIYIGVNRGYGDLTQNLLRQAISAGINREDICRDAYYNNAVAATGFFNPVWKAVKSVQNIETVSNQQITVENLEKIGYNSLDSNGCRINSFGTRLKFNLLVNSENTSKVSAAGLIASQLATYGITINVVQKPYDQYMASLSAGDFQLYLAEVMITDNMDISNLVIEGGSVAYAISAPQPMNTTPEASATGDVSNPENVGAQETTITYADVINGYYNGANSITDVASVLQTEMPIIPVCYRTGVLFYNDKIENVINSSASDIYFSIESYKFKN